MSLLKREVCTMLTGHLGPTRVFLTGVNCLSVTVRGLTILVNFADQSSTTTATDVEHMTNGPDFSANGNISSVRDYFLNCFQWKA